MSLESLLHQIPELAPLDKHNQALADNVHPTDWENPTPSGRYNMVVIGAGTAGLVTAAGAAGLGARVALIERRLMGGDCLNVGCVPSKALIRCARAAADVRRARHFGVQTDEPVVNFTAIMERMRRLRAGISGHDSAARFRDLGVDVFIGEASFVSPASVEVGETRLEFARACIATGARAAAPRIPGLDQIPYLTNESIFSLTELPGRLAILGAGPIGCEMAQTFARFGSEVSLIEAEHGILPREDPEAADVVREALLADGVRLLCCGKQITIQPIDEGARISLDSHGERYDLRADQLLVSVGRAPNVEGLNLEAAGVTYSKRGVATDDGLRTSNRRVFAAGDVCSDFKFTHTADAMARIVLRNALFFGRSRVGALTIPWCTYTDPEIAHVGWSPAEAERRGITVDTIRIDMADVDRAILEGGTEGLLKVHLKKGSDRILGATLVGTHAGDMISELTLAMQSRLGLARLAETIHPYPTRAEIMRKAGDAYNRTRLTPRVKKIFETILRWRR